MEVKRVIELGHLFRELRHAKVKATKTAEVCEFTIQCTINFSRYDFLRNKPNGRNKFTKQNVIMLSNTPPLIQKKRKPTYSDVANQFHAVYLKKMFL